MNAVGTATARKKIVLVDDQITNLNIGRNVLSHIYDVFTVPSGEKLLLLMQKITPDMILLDVEMPVMSGYDVMKIIKSLPDFNHIPVVFVTAKSDLGSELEGFSLGAVDYIYKPYSPPLLLKRIEAHLLVDEQRKELLDLNNNLEEMVTKKTQSVLELQNAVLETMAELVEWRDNETGGHIDRTQKYMRLLVDGLIESGLYSEETSAWDVDLLVLSAQLHDVGKISISDNILTKTERLSQQEFELMKKHAAFGGQVINKIQSKTSEQAFLNYAKVLAEGHHERWDGKGYPNGLSGTDIPLPARLLAIVDVYDALISQRVYKAAYSHEKAVEIIKEGRGTQFDPHLVNLFLSMEDRFKHV
ncbi:MAG: response regulator [Defluviitaleaceae bacterium]|nr:response regulator [Defluviitaleaceae bacterium]MCL2835526.1 response regulator [Defluviitaleaceae bacterium]